MDIKIYEKPVLTRFVTIDGEEFELYKLIPSLEEISETMENDSWGDYSLRDYELFSSETMNKLVKMKLVKNYTGSRMANLYCMSDEKGVEELLNTLYKLDILYDENYKE